jgi:phage anti-repressor protein
MTDIAPIAAENKPLIDIHKARLGGTLIETVDARELHNSLEVRKDFSTWIKDRIAQYGFVDNRDFVGSPELGSEHRIEYRLSLDMAKELAMVERNAKGKQARQYFIECERKLKTARIVRDPGRRQFPLPPIRRFQRCHVALDAGLDLLHPPLD